MSYFTRNRNRPLLLLAYADSAHAARCGRFFRRQGWEVRLVASAAEARQLLSRLTPRAIVLDTELPDENGWLTCAKIAHEDASRMAPPRKVILLAPDRSTETLQHLASVNAVALITRDDPVEAMAETILGESFAEAV
jgi:DNA-binding response OmpR family regulator